MVSIIMGVYNGEKTLREAMNSILAQTYQDWEFIICDDCSTDGSIAILEEYRNKDDRIIIIRNEHNSGLAASLNHCLEYVSGEYIARMDCDDISTPDRFEKQIDYLSNHPGCDLVGTYMQGFNENGLLRVISQRIEPTKYDVPKGNPFHHATVMMKTSIMKALQGYTVSQRTLRMEDVELWYRFFAAGYKGVTIPEPLYLVRLDEGAYKRRKLRFMLDASAIMWEGIGKLQLPFYYRVFCVKPILSWLLPETLKRRLHGNG